MRIASPYFIAMPFVALQFSCEQIKTPDVTIKGNTYYLNINGNDSNKGTIKLGAVTLCFFKADRSK